MYLIYYILYISYHINTTFLYFNHKLNFKSLIYSAIVKKYLIFIDFAYN